jgi:hypothetical protein
VLELSLLAHWRRSDTPDHIAVGSLDFPFLDQALHQEQIFPSPTRSKRGSPDLTSIDQQFVDAVTQAPLAGSFPSIAACQIDSCEAYHTSLTTILQLNRYQVRASTLHLLLSSASRITGVPPKV